MFGEGRLITLNILRHIYVADYYCPCLYKLKGHAGGSEYKVRKRKGPKTEYFPREQKISSSRQKNVYPSKSNRKNY